MDKRKSLKMQGKVCLKCGRAVGPDDNYCTMCGAPQFEGKARELLIDAFTKDLMRDLEKDLRVKVTKTLDKMQAEEPEKYANLIGLFMKGRA